MKTPGDLREALDELQRTIPFCNAAPVLLAEEEPVPTGVGGNCVYQSRLLAERLQSQGWIVQFLRDQEGVHATHRACVAEKEGIGSFYLDPSLLVHGPIALDTLPEDREASFWSYPGAGSTFCPVKVSRNKKILTVQKFCLSAKGDPIYDFKYNLGKASSSLPKDDDLYIASRPKTEFNLTTLDSTSGVLEVRHHIGKGTLAIMKLGGTHGKVTFNEALGQNIPAAVLEEVSNTFQLSPDELRAFFTKATEAYQRIRRVVH